MLQFFALIAGASALADTVVINELMYHPASEDRREEYIELYNQGSATVDLAGWRLTAGVRYAFSNVSIAPGGYLVVTADPAVFANKYPGVADVTGSWEGQLSNSGEKVELQNAYGQVIDSVSYSEAGDWGDRLRGSGENRVLNLTRSASRATVTVPGNFSSSDIVILSGADQPEYNGKFTVSSANAAYFRVSVSGEPASPATGLILCRQVTDYTRTGWAWSSRADGMGSSLELINPLMPNQHGQNWRSSSMINGTPGWANSVLSANLAPLILQTRHTPLVPRSTDTVTINAEVQDEQPGGVAVALRWRVDSLSPPDFSSTAMADDGAHNDGLAGDRVYGAILPPQTNNTVIEFYVEARDASGNVRTWPAPALDENRALIQRANALYQVDDTPYTGRQPLYRLIMREAERIELQGYPSDSTYRSSNARMNATFIAIDGTSAEVRYLVGIRDRGAGTRAYQPANYNVALPPDQPWHGVDSFNLNTYYTHAQMAGYAVASLAGLHTEHARLVQVRVNNYNRASSGSPQYGCYVLIESTDDAYVDNHFPDDSGGNLYRCQSGAHTCLLQYLGANSTSYVNSGYSKKSNTGENNWSDLIHLTEVLNLMPDADYADAVRQVVDVEEWMRYFAVYTLTDSKETSLANGAGDDFSMYRGVADPRFKLLAHDWDTIINEGDGRGNVSDSLFRMVPVVMGVTNYNCGAVVLNRFMLHPEFVPLYYAELKRLCDTVFAPEQLGHTLRQVLDGVVPETVLNRMQVFNADHVAYVRSHIPLRLTVTTGLATASGFPRTTTNSLVLQGRANVIETRSIQVNGQAADWSAWQGRWTAAGVALRPGINRLLVQAFDASGHERDRLTVDIWRDDVPVQTVSGSILADTQWLAANGPYHVRADLAVASGATLTIEPGTSVYLGVGARLVVAEGGRLLAEGTAIAPIRFTRVPGSTTTWGGITIRGSPGSAESRIAYAHLEFNGATAIHSDGGTIFLEHLTFGTTDQPYLSLDGSSFVVSECVFPAPTASFEPVHGTGGIKSGGRGLFLRNFFGAISGYSDGIDFTGGNRPGPIVEFINNVFLGSGDDLIDLNGTDAWIEGNIFLHAHKNGSPDTSSGVSGGQDSGNTSEVTIMGNLFYNCDHAAMAKEGNFFTLINNTIVHQTHQGGLDTDGAVICLADEGMAEGAGMYLEGNIIYDAEKLVRNLTSAALTFTNNLMPFPWSGPGGGNSTDDPRFKYVPQLAETQFTTWEQAQVMRDWFSLLPGSPARGTGPNHVDKGGAVPIGVSIANEPVGTNHQTSATLTVGVARNGYGISAAGWPNGSGYTHYRWRIDSGPWSPETPTLTPLSLTGLANGRHFVEVTGRRDSGSYQDAPEFGADAVITGSQSWTVNTNHVSPEPPPTVRINEILARNVTAVPIGGAYYPDLVELCNVGSAPSDLSGLSLSDDALDPGKFVFPAGTVLGAGQYLVLYGGYDPEVTGFQLGFRLSQDGDTLFLFDRASRGRTRLDAVSFGPQLPDLSIGRVADGHWTLTRPTFGTANFVVPLGDPHRLKINEWQADGFSSYASDFIELFNPDPLPVDLGGLFLSDNPVAMPSQHCVAPLSFIPSGGLVVFNADAPDVPAPSHLNFQLSPHQGMIGLFDADGIAIDQVLYGPQKTDVSQGRSPNGAHEFAFFSLPTPGAGNPVIRIEVTTVETALLVLSHAWKYYQNGDDLGLDWTAPGYRDDSWSAGPGLLCCEDDPLPAPINTILSLTNSQGTYVTTYYFRTHFNFPTRPAAVNLNAYLCVDDGAIFYLNGKEVLRVGMPYGPVNSTTFASRNVGNAILDGPYAIPSSSLAQGDNVLAVEVHQINDTSGDVVFGMTLNSVVTVTNVSANNVVLSEVLVSSGAATGAPDADQDWIELYNPLPDPVDLSELSLSDDATVPRKWLFPFGTILAAGEYRVVDCDSQVSASATNTGFGLEANGDAIFLFDAPARGGALLDWVRFGMQPHGFSIGRVGAEWRLNLPSPTAPNLQAGLGNVTAVRINELMASPTSGDDWFELYNPNHQPVELSGLYLTDDLLDPTQYQIPPLSFLGIGSTAYERFWADDAPAAGSHHVNFKLSADGEVLALFLPRGVVLDQIAFGPQVSGISQGRLPDGSANWSNLPTPTPGHANITDPADADGDRMPDEWELAHGLNPNEDDTALDPDRDGLNNLQEYLAGTHPRDSNSTLRVVSIARVAQANLLTFIAVAGKSYAVEFREVLGPGEWARLAGIPPNPATVSVTITDSNASATRFYRLVTP